MQLIWDDWKIYYCNETNLAFITCLGSHLAEGSNALLPMYDPTGYLDIWIRHDFSQVYEIFTCILARTVTIYRKPSLSRVWTLLRRWWGSWATTSISADTGPNTLEGCTEKPNKKQLLRLIFPVCKNCKEEVLNPNHKSLKLVKRLKVSVVRKLIRKPFEK